MVVVAMVVEVVEVVGIVVVVVVVVVVVERARATDRDTSAVVEMAVVATEEVVFSETAAPEHDIIRTRTELGTTAKRLMIGVSDRLLRFPLPPVPEPAGPDASRGLLMGHPRSEGRRTQGRKP